MKRIIIVLITTFLAYTGFSQNSLEPGMKFSLNWSKSNVKYTPNFAAEDSVKENRVFSFGESVFLRYNIGQHFSVEGGIGLLYKGFQKTFTTPVKKDTASQKYILRDQFEFIDVKAKFYYNFYPVHNLRISPGIGLGLSVLLQEKQTTKLLPSDTSRVLSVFIVGGTTFFNWYKKYNFITELSVMATYRVSKNVNLFVEPYYSIQTNNLIKNPASGQTDFTNLKPNSYGISFGVSFNIDVEAPEKNKEY
jgi:hypothetical protein